MIILINPNVCVLKRDLFTTGIVYMPIGLAYFAASLKRAGFAFTVIDAFAEAPNRVREKDGFIFRGLTADEVCQKFPKKTKIAFIYARAITSHLSLLEIARVIKEKYPNIITVVLENTQAVTAYSLARIQQDFHKESVDYILSGEAEERGVELINSLIDKGFAVDIEGIGFERGTKVEYRAPERIIDDLDSLPFPSWEFFPLDNYWNLKYSHGPFETKRYLPILTSRGCPYDCTFCVATDTNKHRWRARSPKNVVDEIEYYLKKYAVSEFHIEDLNPTVSDERMKEISGEIINRKLNIIWKIVSGTKIETIKDAQTIKLLAKAGCNYISFSPETGSPKVLESINKSFDECHAFSMLKAARKEKIKTQACFVIGFPGEKSEDLKLTYNLARKLTKAGVDEIAVFMITPVPGSRLYEAMNKDFLNYSQLNFSPTWREDYEQLSRFRLCLYRSFLLWKLIYNPIEFLKQPIRFIRRKFLTKMEMVPYRALMTKVIVWKGGGCVSV